MPIMGGGGAAFNGGTITDPVVVATGSGETPLSLQPDGTEVFVVSEFGEITVSQPVASSWPLRILNLDGNEILSVKNAAVKQTTVLGWGAGDNALLVAVPVGNQTPHLISFDLHDDGALVGDLGHVRSANYGTDNQTALLLVTTRAGESGGAGSSELLGEGTITLRKPEHSTAAFIDAVDAATSAHRFTLSKSGAILNRLSTGVSLTVQDSAGNPIFRVDENGSVHIKTGTSIVADL